MYGIMRFLGFIHFILFVFTTIYVFIFSQKIWLDKLYLIYFFLVNIHWFFLNGECLIAYIYKKYLSNSYKLGEKPSQNKDISDIFSGIIPNKYIDFLVVLLLILYLYNVYIVFIRNNFDKFLTIFLVLSYIIYIILLRISVEVAHKYSYIHLVLYTFTFFIYVKSL